MCRVQSPNCTRAAITPPATREEAAAIIAAVERFRRATAPPASAPAPDATEAWSRAAIVEGVERDPTTDVRDPWMSA